MLEVAVVCVAHILMTIKKYSLFASVFRAHNLASVIINEYGQRKSSQYRVGCAACGTSSSISSICVEIAACVRVGVKLKNSVLCRI